MFYFTCIATSATVCINEELVQVIATYPTTKPFNVRVDRDVNVLDFGLIHEFIILASLQLSEQANKMVSLVSMK